MKTTDAVANYLTWFEVHGYSKGTLRARRYYLASFLSFLDEREVFDVESISPSVLDSYQRHLYHQKKANGLPLSFRTQAQRLIPVKGLFAWLARTGELPYDLSISVGCPRSSTGCPKRSSALKKLKRSLPDPTRRHCWVFVIARYWRFSTRRRFVARSCCTCEWLTWTTHDARSSCVKVRARVIASCRSASERATGCSAISTRCDPNSNGDAHIPRSFSASPVGASPRT